MRSLAIAASFLFLLGCGAGDETRTRRPELSEARAIDITPSVNACPEFASSLILPQEVPLATAAFVAVRAVDPDADDLDLKYSWTATAGDFSEADSPITEYRCRESGAQVLTVIAHDAFDCDAELHLDVTCLSE